jgi:hypothetical protein
MFLQPLRPAAPFMQRMGNCAAQFISRRDLLPNSYAFEPGFKLFKPGNVILFYPTAGLK